MLYARVGDKLYIHGARSSRMMRLLAAGQEACVTVTLLHGLVLARSAFEHSANYESVVAFGRFESIDDDAQRLAALAAFTDKLLPGRFSEVRSPNAKGDEGDGGPGDADRPGPVYVRYPASCQPA
jgi:nitroimidazol reductase NimA-like FMN-containing flavoprotein (pyridoxamine 5'-phosphate oxidase superfamily)